MIFSKMAIKHVSGNDKGDDRYYGCYKKLPRPKFILQEERNGREQTGNDAADHLGSESHDDTSKETPHTYQEAGQCKQTLVMHPRKARG